MKTWKNLTQLREIAQEAGIKGAHRKDKATLLEALDEKGVEVPETATVEETATNPEKPTETKEEKTDDGDKKKADEPKPEAKSSDETGRKRSDLEECQKRITDLLKKLDNERAIQSELIEQAASENKPRSIIELLQESKALNKDSKALQKANERRALQRAVTTTPIGMIKR